MLISSCFFWRIKKLPLQFFLRPRWGHPKKPWPAPVLSTPPNKSKPKTSQFFKNRHYKNSGIFTGFENLSNYIAWRVVAEYVRAKILALRNLKGFKDRKALKLLWSCPVNNSPAARARELFKLSTDSEDLLVPITKCWEVLDLSFCVSYVIIGGGWGLFGSLHLDLSFHPQEWASCLFFKEKLGETPHLRSSWLAF